MSENNTTQTEANQVNQPSTEASQNNVSDAIPKSRFDEVNTQKNDYKSQVSDLQSQLDKFKADQESARKKELEKQGEYKTLLDEQAKDLAKFQADSEAWNTYKTDKRANIMESIKNDDDKLIAEGLSLDKLEVFAKRVTQTNTVGTPNQRPANSNKGTGDFGGYSSWAEFAINDPQGADKALRNIK